MKRKGLKKRTVALLLTFSLIMSGSVLTWAAPETADNNMQDEDNVNIYAKNTDSIEGNFENVDTGKYDSGFTDDIEEIDDSQETDSFTLDSDLDPDGEFFIAKQDIILNQSNIIWDGTIASSFCEGSGTASDPYLIGNGSELAYFQQMVNSGNSYEGQYIALSSDIYLNEISDYDSWSDSNSPSNCWAGISGFAGNFNGCSHTIYGLYMYGADNTGFFNEISNDTETVIENLNFKNAYVHGQSYVGTIVGKGSHIQMAKCSVSGKVIGNDIVGGLMGTSEGGSIINNTNYASVTGANRVGGIFGSYGNFYSLDNGTYLGTHSVLTDCINKGEIYGNGDYVGGIAGYLGYNTNALDCIRLGNENTVTGTRYYVGGIFGQYDVNDFGEETSKKFEQCYNWADISGGSDVGGIVGHMDINENRVALQDSYNSGTCTETLSEYNSTVAGIVGAIRRSGNCRVIIQRCHNIGKITGSANTVNTECAIMGTNQIVVNGGRLQMFCCYYLSNSAPNSTNGIGLSPEEMVDSEKFSQFDFDSVWKMGIKYPVLLWQEANSVIETPEIIVTKKTIQGAIEHSYGSKTADTKVEELLSEYVDDWYSAYIGYTDAVEDVLMDSVEASTPTKKQAIKRRKEAMIEADRNSKNKEKYIVTGGGFPDEKTEEAVYEALSTFLYETICSEIDLSGISAEEKNKQKLIDVIFNSVKEASISKTYKINGIKVSINTTGESGLSFGKITCNSGYCHTYVICPSMSQCRKAITNYMKELMGLNNSAIYQVYSAISKDVLGVSLDKLTENYLKQNLTNRVSKYASKFNESGIGDLATNLNSCYNYYQYTKKMLGIIDGKDSPEKILKAMEAYGKFEDSSISDKVVKKTWKELKKAATNLNEAYLSYLSGTDSKLGIWWDIVKPKWGKKDTKAKAIFSCPVNVVILNSSGQQIGYAGEDDVWFDSNIIYVEEKGDAKIIYSSSEEPISFNVSATAYGVLGCSIEDYDEIGLPAGRTNYYDIELYPGKNITVSGIKNAADGKVAYTVTSDGQTINANEYIPSTQNAVVSIGCNVINNGTVDGTGSYVRGDAVVLTATPSDNSRFVGWMQGEHLLDTARIYEFTAKENTAITALFAEISDTSEEESEDPSGSGGSNNGTGGSNNNQADNNGINNDNPVFTDVSVNNAPASTTSPQTGDENSLLILIITMLIAGGVVAVNITSKKRKHI